MKAGQTLAQTRPGCKDSNLELQQLMTAILFRKKIEMSPYSGLIQRNVKKLRLKYITVYTVYFQYSDFEFWWFEFNFWSVLNSTAEICDDLMNDYAFINEMPELSFEHLFHAHEAGCIALPALVGIRSIMEQRNIYQSQKGELPIEIDLPKSLR